MNISEYQKESAIVGDSEEDTKLLRLMALEARRYLTGFAWCPAVRSLYLADGMGSVFAVFLAELAEKVGAEDGFLWVVVGDLPSAYLVTDDISSAKEALESYCEIMDEWVEAATSGKGLEKVFPVSAQPTPANAQTLAKRLRFLREKIIPSLI